MLKLYCPPSYPRHQLLQTLGMKRNFTVNDRGSDEIPLEWTPKGLGVTTDVNLEVSVFW